MIKNMIQEIINFLFTYIKAHGCTEMNKWVEFLEQLGWHPASELPSLDENSNSKDVIVICGTTNFHCDLPRWSAVVGGVWGDKGVKWWCYPPKEE